MIIVTKNYNVRNTVVTINVSLSKVAEWLAGAISLLHSSIGEELVDITESQNECMIKIGVTWYELLIVIYKAITMFVTI